MSEITKLTRNRQAVESQLNRFSEFLHALGESPSKSSIIVRLNRANKLLDEFNEIQALIEDCNNSEIDYEVREEFEEKFYSVTSLADELIQPTESKINNTLPNNTNLNIRLPTINLPTFSGNYVDWQGFNGTFKNIVHDNCSLSNIQKFYYLKSALRGEAEQLLKGLEVSEENYTIAWNLLKERFENKKLTTYNHIKGFMELPCIAKENGQTLRKLIDDASMHVRALKALGQPVEHWDSLTIYVLINKLDTSTRRDWETFSCNIESPKFDDLAKHLRNKCQLLETMDTREKVKQRNNQTYFTANNAVCSHCKGTHHIYKCFKFLELKPQQRFTVVRDKRLCTNCLSKSHMAVNCKSLNSCRSCNKKHNSLLHFETNDDITDVTEQPQTSMVNHSRTHKSEHHVLLSTAVVYILDKNREPIKCRALLDSGSQSNFITEELCHQIGLKKHHISIPIIGISNAHTTIKHRIDATIKSTCNNFNQNLNLLVLPHITSRMPSQYFETSNINIPENITLADPNFNYPDKIDLLLGASIFWELLCVGQIKLGQNKPILQKTKLGWVISGPIHSDSFNSISCVSLSMDNIIQHQIERFWNIEELNEKRKLTAEEEACERHFVENTTRDENGRFLVSLPFKDNPASLGDSLETATKRFKSLEGKLSRNKELQEEYIKFIEEYIDLGHMSSIPTSEINSTNSTFYLPHHGVLKPSSSTTKLRVVFDASAKTTNNTSLNDLLSVGPTTQDDLFSILTRFRKHNVVLIADIAKMYRQVNIKPSERDLQRILWRTHPSEEVKHFRLNTVTYGTASASFLAIRALQQIAFDIESDKPLIAKAILKDFYVDDLVTGTASMEEAHYLKSNLTNILSGYGFELRKWISNCRNIVDSQTKQNNYHITDDDSIKALGMLWDPSADSFKYNINMDLCNQKVSKRTILSTTAQIFDPLGLIGAITVRAKIILQRLWQLKLDWDESIPTDLYTTWVSFIKSIQILNELRIPRHIVLQNAVKITIHGFCDASEAAYGANIYIRSIDACGNIATHLVSAKSRVAPLKTISLPRLELCGAMLLSRLVDKCMNAIDIHIEHVYLWCDSTIVLAWIATPCNMWNTFVANRVNEIQQLTRAHTWKHVSSKENPADIISRGIDPKEILHNTLWWQGPYWLSQEKHHWPQEKIQEDVQLERKRTLKSFLAVNTLDIFDKYSSLSRLSNVIAYCLRFSNNTKQSKEQRREGRLSCLETNSALQTLIKILQSEQFPQEIQDLKCKKTLSPRSKILCLDPFIDEQGLLRVGGRLLHSNITYSRKHPIILPNKHNLTSLIINQEHKRQLHAGIHGTLASVRQKYWPINGRSAVQRELRKCITCFRSNPSNETRKMGNLPSLRLQPSRPFLNSGVDYAGPLFIKDGKTRCRKIVKAYLCIFICLSTKAVHLELVNDLSTEAFLNALKRFIARRGICSNMYSDNGTNFVGANNYLLDVNTTVRKSINSEKGQDFFQKNKIQWHFIPPRAPHFGGIWEAAVKCAKSHIKKIVGNTNLTFEGLYTILTQIEAILNSRPLLPLSNDPNDLTPLTPSHFLIGEPMTSLPEENVVDVPSNRLPNYKLLQQMVQHFWKRWSKEYISSLQQRSKWKKGSPTSIEVGSLVLVKEDNLPPLQWKLGRITEVHPGTDGEIRVVTVKTITGTVQRPTVKVCALPKDI